MNEKATSDIERELERVKAKAEAAGLKVKAKIVDPETQGKVKGAMDKIVELHIPSHVYSGAKKGKNKLVNLSGKLKDTIKEKNELRKKKNELRKKVEAEIVGMGDRMANITERLDKLEEKSKEES